MAAPQLPSVRRVRISDFRCIRQVELALTPLHALIGPNDSGKSSLLCALGAGKRKRPLLRLDPDALRRSADLRVGVEPARWFTDERGSGLAALYDGLWRRDRQSFASVERGFATLFPSVNQPLVETLPDGAMALGVTLRSGERVGASEMSDGMLCWLAFAIIEHLPPMEMLLIEEPASCLHPSRVCDVMAILRRISKHTQIVVATHSPLVINELQADEVTIVTRSATSGTICTPLVQTTSFEERSAVYALGELWLSYADGDFESDLVGEENE